MAETISFLEYTFERCNDFWLHYVADPDMLDTPFVYNREWVEHYFEKKVKSPNRCYFAVVLGDKTIGEMQLKQIDLDAGHATMSFHLANDEYKNRGFGTQAERIILEYAFDNLKLKTVYADCVHRNKRSQHVMEKIGFTLIREDEDMKYYEIQSSQYHNNCK